MVTNRQERHNAAAASVNAFGACDCAAQLHVLLDGKVRTMLGRGYVHTQLLYSRVVTSLAQGKICVDVEFLCLVMATLSVLAVGHGGFDWLPDSSWLAVILSELSQKDMLLSTGGAKPELKINIEGMMCDGCSSRIETVLKGMEAVKTVNVSLEGKVAVVQLAKGATDSTEAQAAAAALVDTINSLGFEAKLQQ
ncbi:hypothetical protein VOLCADRAFT_90457 [Volvox carteri f. nagariensis]|uniref:HMA domain-containing protein n=1 Tax=Volvox carteri f. nagariensis TaxID=3068 RepID=D8TUF4_VOLCA|nr:uncharacterized protein VOLCADRAFT_90457 [Volvox carteri f. nagariensis]EFJ48815.1 hypothetical protein VOLCADRAFT_90457 [Volvox carteri f. nagariensis]|eukprot:XP_002950147.1 hypothetical protein VOLCADRAFT_90457 [Volvox carteri f. nagariensis]